MRKRFMSVERLEAVARAALQGGYGRMEYFRDGSPRRLMELTIKHDCMQPHHYELHARWSGQHGKKVLPLTIRGSARCRKCENCMDYRGWQWKTRAENEMAQNAMTLFGSFTMSPEQHYLLDGRIMSGTRDARHVDKWKRPPCSMRDLSAQEVFTKRVQAFGDLLTEYLWRIRQGRSREKPHLRYLLVAERHDGATTSLEMRDRPHFHILLHTNTPNRLVRGSPFSGDGEWYVNRKKQIFVSDSAWLRTQWTFGFTKFELATSSRAAWYVCKYISKSLDCRVRASQGYGKTQIGCDLSLSSGDDENRARASTST